jgi:GGDEF domain-containing protein
MPSPAEPGGFMQFAQHALDMAVRDAHDAVLVLWQIEPRVGGSGHPTDDLAVFANTLRDVLRDSDVIGRIGDTRFAALLTGIPRDDVDHVIARVHSTLDARAAMRVLPSRIPCHAATARWSGASHPRVEELVAQATVTLDAILRNERHRPRR